MPPWSAERLALVVLLSFNTLQLLPWSPFRIPSFLAWGLRCPKAKIPIVRVPMPLLLSSTEAALIATGLETSTAHIVARGLVAAQRDGRAAHGLARLPAILRSLRTGEVASSAQPQLKHLRPGVLHVDADCGFALPAIMHALPALASAARGQGVAALSVVDARGIVGALWVPLEELAAQHGLASLALCNTPAFVCPAGGSQRVFGTNPIAFAWPRPAPALPMVFDFASAALSRGAMQEAARRGSPLPPNTALDAQGKPTIDAAAGLQGAQLPFGGDAGQHKGALCALLVELLAAAWTGADLAVEGGGCSEGGVMRRGLCVLAFDVEALQPAGAAQSKAEALFAALVAAGGRLPGDSRYTHRRRSEKRGSDGEKGAGDGVVVSVALLQECFGTVDLQVLGRGKASDGAEDLDGECESRGS